MRIAKLCVNRCPLRPLGGKDTGGMHLYVRELSRELGRMGVEVDLFTRWHSSMDTEVMEIGDRVRLIHIEAGEQEDILKTDIYHCLPQFTSNLRRFIESESVTYNLVHSHYWLSALVGEQIQDRFGIPHIATFHTLGEVKNRMRPAEMEPYLRIEAEKKAVASADRVIAVSAEEKHDLVNIYKTGSDKVKVIPCGIDLGHFQFKGKGKARRELGFSEHSKILLFVGRIEPFKGIDVILHIVASLQEKKDLHLLIVGGDADSNGELARLHSLAHQLGIEEMVTFWGAVEHERIPLFFNAADICVIASFHESFGLVAAEALASGTPVVAPRVGGLSTIITDGETGYLTDSRSIEAFTLQLERLLNDDGLRQRMGHAARQSVTKYAWPIVARQVLGIYEELTTAQVPLMP